MVESDATGCKQPVDTAARLRYHSFVAHEATHCLSGGELLWPVRPPR